MLFSVFAYTEVMFFARYMLYMSVSVYCITFKQIMRIHVYMCVFASFSSGNHTRICGCANIHCTFPVGSVQTVLGVN